MQLIKKINTLSDRFIVILGERKCKKGAQKTRKNS